MKRLNIFFFAIFITLASGCSSSSSSSSDSNVTCLGEQCTSEECIDKQLLSSKDGMLDFCKSPAFGTFAIEKDGITWHFGESVSYGQFVNGDYWVLDKGKGVKITKVSPGPSDGRNGSVINPKVGSQAYDNRIRYYDKTQLVTFPAVVKAGDSLVSTISVKDSDIRSGRITPSWGAKSVHQNHAKLMKASVLTVVSEVPKAGSFRPALVGDDKKIYNVSDINRSLLPNYKAPSVVPKVSYLERGVERPWLMHLRHYTNRAMHPVENMPNYFSDVGQFLSKISLVLLTDAKTDKLLYGFIQTGIDQHASIINGVADNSSFEFHTILTGLLLSDESMARTWVDGKSRTDGRAKKFYFPNEMTSNLSSSKIPKGQTWTGFEVMFRKQLNAEHEHLHPSEWGSVALGTGRKQEVYRNCCDSIPHFGMVMTSRVLKAERYWPSAAIDRYMDRWVWESTNGIGLDVIRSKYADFSSFYTSSNDKGTRPHLVGGDFNDAMYLALGFDPKGAGPTFGSGLKYEARFDIKDSVVTSETDTDSVSAESPKQDSSVGGEAVSEAESGSSSSASNTDTDQTASEDVSSGQADASQDEAIVYSDVYKAERSLQKDYNADIKASRAVYNAESKARREAYNAERAALTAAYENGSLSRAEFITQRRALRAEFIAQRSARRAEFKAAKAARRALLDADNAALLQQFNSGGSNIIQDTRTLPANN